MADDMRAALTPGTPSVAIRHCRSTLAPVRSLPLSLAARHLTAVHFLSFVLLVTALDNAAALTPAVES